MLVMGAIDSSFLYVQLFHFMISSLKSGRSSALLDVIVELLYPVISLQVNLCEFYASMGLVHIDSLTLN